MIVKYLLKKIIPIVNGVISDTLGCVYDRIETLEIKLDKLEKRRK